MAGGYALAAEDAAPGAKFSATKRFAHDTGNHFYSLRQSRCKGIPAMNRKFTAKQRRYLYLLAGGRCENCGLELAAGFHGDHKQAFSKGGETALHNGQALCPQCNLKKGNKP